MLADQIRGCKGKNENTDARFLKKKMYTHKRGSCSQATRIQINRYVCVWNRSREKFSRDAGKFEMSGKEKREGTSDVCLSE